MSDERPNPTNFYEVYRDYPPLIMMHDLEQVLGDYASLEFDKSRYRDPTYLSFCRFFLADLLRVGLSSKSGIDSLLEKNLKLGVNGKGLLWDDDIEQIVHHGITFPVPWTPERCASVEPPRKYMGYGGAFDIDIPFYLENGILVGFTSGVWDLGHAGHYRFLQECDRLLAEIQIKSGRKGRLLVVGVDENTLVGERKGVTRPLQDFAVRVGTLSEIDCVTVIYRVMDLQASYHASVGGERMYTSFPISLIDPYTIRNPVAYDRIEAARKLLDSSDPTWVQTYGKNLVFFWTDTDPLADFKKAWVEMIGGTGVGVPKFTNLSTTVLAEHFGIRQASYMPNRFGKDPWWVRMYQEQGRRLVRGWS